MSNIDIQVTNIVNELDNNTRSEQKLILRSVKQRLGISRFSYISYLIGLVIGITLFSIYIYLI